MCHGESAPNTIDTWNGWEGWGYAEPHSQKHPGQPLVWTENQGWFESWGVKYDPINPTPDNEKPALNVSPARKAFSIGAWYAMGGAYHNYYSFLLPLLSFFFFFADEKNRPQKTQSVVRRKSYRTMGSFEYSQLLCRRSHVS